MKIQNLTSLIPSGSNKLRAGWLAVLCLVIFTSYAISIAIMNLEPNASLIIPFDIESEKHGNTDLPDYITPYSDLYIDTLVMTFKEQLDYFLDSGMVWKIKDENGILMERGIGPISGKFFSKPGWYTLDLTQPLNFGVGLFSSSGIQINHNSCNHSPFPDILNVLVSESYFKFDFSSVEFSKPLSGGSVEGIIVTVKADYDHFQSKELDPKKLKILASGVGAQVIGELLVSNSIIKKGENILRYKLSGTFQKNTYIQLDFYDTNQQIQSYHHTTKLY